MTMRDRKNLLRNAGDWYRGFGRCFGGERIGRLRESFCVRRGEFCMPGYKKKKGWHRYGLEDGRQQTADGSRVVGVADMDFSCRA
jgi:hypothetical protein